MSPAFAPLPLSPPRSPLEDAAHDLSMAVADFYVLITRATTPDDIARIWTTLQQMEQFVTGCERAAARKADTL